MIKLGWIALACGGFNFFHVSTLFENDRHFSHLSTLEREMTFRTEMALYYSYYKRIIQAPTFFSGLREIMQDNITEFPSTINTLQRFNLYPEVMINPMDQQVIIQVWYSATAVSFLQLVLGGAFRGFKTFTDTLGITTKECWQVDRGEGMSDVWSCEGNSLYNSNSFLWSLCKLFWLYIGLGDPTYFYVNGVFICAAVTACLLFIYGSFLSKSILGGVITILCFFFNHSEVRIYHTQWIKEFFGIFLLNGTQCTRVQWTPPLRESFGFPLILAQLLSISWCLRETVNLNWKHLCWIAMTTSASLVTWQFSQFVFLTQGVALLVLWFQNRPARPAITVIFLGQIVGLQNAVLLVFANDMLLSSLYGCSLVIALSFILFVPSFSSSRQGEGANLKNMFVHGVLIAAGTLLLRRAVTYLIGSGDDVLHI